ncbi:unnamed protein product [Paramecium sonneborni]|uniref:Uncharacterized protein n=1 Tax=Paramecium sonneborni TaxID=65129 RepID=A0A8S1M1X8_9CILI|nr:unnamed protein product [Paramecium sonneborni]
MIPGSSQIQTGLLTNQQNKKYQETQKEVDIELQDMANQQSYVLLQDGQLNTQPKQQQLLNYQTQPQGYNHLSQYQIQYFNQNQQQQSVPQNLTINYQQSCKNQQFGLKQHLIQTHYAMCIFCKTPQTIQNDQKPFMCYQCRNVQQPKYDFLKCSHCKVTVKYQQGISSIIKCTKCNNHNFVQLKPQAQDIQGKEKI